MGYGPLLLSLLLTAGFADPQIEGLLARVSEEAEVFRRTAVKLIAQETLRQRALQPPPRFRPRAGQAATQPPPIVYRTREIVSEYSYGVLRDSPGSLHEFRQVLSVDGRPVSAPARARRKLLAGLSSPDDRARQSMLEEFARYTLRGAATDFGPALLLFAPGRMGDYRFEAAGKARVGAEPALILRFRQTGGPGPSPYSKPGRSFAMRWKANSGCARPTACPCASSSGANASQGPDTLSDHATIEYAPAPFGVLVPVSVVRRLHAGELLLEEDVFRYSPFRMFAADAEIKFP
jgi:hypothetical protein